MGGRLFGNARPHRHISLNAGRIFRRRTIHHHFHSEPQVIFSGIQPTGVPHLGNYLGAFGEWVRLQDEALPTTRLYFSIADLHALTSNKRPEKLQSWKRQMLATLLAVGLDPERSTLFYQSSVPAHTELLWILSCTASVGHLSRMTQWKTKLGLGEGDHVDSQTKQQNLKLGLFSYPVLQAADILLYGTTRVPVGQDQAQHIEFTRDCAKTFNSIYGQIFARPEPIISPAKRIMSLKDPSLKMSKSETDDRSRINLTDSPEEISQKIRHALTDSESGGISYDPIARPGISNLLAILSHLHHLNGQRQEQNSPEDLARQYGSLSLREFKQVVATTVSGHLQDFRLRYMQLVKEENAGYLDEVAARGARKARDRADVMLLKVRKAVGLI